MRKIAPLVLAGAALLASCGYSPLYMPAGSADAAINRVQIGEVRMSRVEYNVGERRVAQTVSQKLQLSFPNEGATLDTVTVDILEGTNTLAVEQTATVSRAQIDLRGTVIVTSPQGKKVLKAEIVTSSSYNVESSPYGTEAGKTSARLTAARSLADEIARRLALFYRTHPAAQVAR